MRLDAAINSFVANTIAALQMAGTVAGARVHVDGGQAQAYAAGWDDALRSVALALGVVDMPAVAAARPAPAALPSGVYLTPAQRTVARLIVSGMTTRQIAAELTIEAGTVKTHRRALSKLLGASEAAGLRPFAHLFGDIAG